MTHPHALRNNSEEEIDIGAIEALRAGDRGALAVLVGRLLAAVDPVKCSKALGDFWFGVQAALEQGDSLDDAVGVPASSRGHPISQRAADRNADAALYFHICTMRGLTKREASDRTANAFTLENVPRVIRGTRAPDIDGPDHPTGNAGEVINHWDRYFQDAYPSIWKKVPLPPKPARRQNTK